jgi:hypothetical protein
VREPPDIDEQARQQRTNSDAVGAAVRAPRTGIRPRVAPADRRTERDSTQVNSDCRLGMGHTDDGRVER